MSYGFKSWLHSISKKTRYNPRGNGQVERHNGIIWKTVLVALRSKNLLLTHWEHVLPEALQSIRSLLCADTNCTPHKRMFFHTRKSCYGVSLPSWIKPGCMLSITIEVISLSYLLKRLSYLRTIFIMYM